MAETLSIILMLAATAALIAFLDFVLRNKDEAFGREKAPADVGENVRAEAFDAHETSPISDNGRVAK